ncbi:hypothetical protein SODALDRAFT_327322 [Sodiomyces alkalinus F11]|uniref:Glutamyl-tRNA synthetase n=1 Tax=Sodiomyces alkalinus (strain CBS 110278 / VKM F-3762 / F11) TaxID=1314773 RepID=A0A3N2Q8Q8_SODAK|nr:hypothetical protein SODALDRAFT_327322 [Sodiomyces alkalinus F11]ROT43154.1 hypothetical protein SODALDRAFT_327322 [Sodiomyces alkalinus F11]
MKASSNPVSLPPLPPNYAKALELIDDAHKEDPKQTTTAPLMPYELHYAQKMTRWLAARCPDAAPVLQLACRAQHFRRWEIPRSSYPMTRAGYLTWRAKLKAQCAEQVATLLASSPAIQPPLPEEDVARVAALMRKEGLGKGGGTGADAETQVLEDVACLVFLDDQFEDFKTREGIDEDKIVGILRKTWGKMSDRGRQLALGMDLSDRARALVLKALEEE